VDANGGYAASIGCVMCVCVRVCVCVCECVSIARGCRGHMCSLILSLPLTHSLIPSLSHSRCCSRLLFDLVSDDSSRLRLSLERRFMGDDNAVRVFLRDLREHTSHVAALRCT
jgi:hypothetical protein